MSKDILSVENITMQFGGVVAVNNLSLHIPEGQIVALIGPNGAGKTTAFNCMLQLLTSMSPQTARSNSAARPSWKTIRRAR